MSDIFSGLTTDALNYFDSSQGTLTDPGAGQVTQGSSPLANPTPSTNTNPVSTTPTNSGSALTYLTTLLTGGTQVANTILNQGKTTTNAPAPVKSSSPVSSPVSTTIYWVIGGAVALLLLGIGLIFALRK